MLGITVVGLFLTPVFIYVIDGLSRSAAFTSPAARLAGTLLLDAATLGLHRLAGPLVRRRRFVPPATVPKRALLPSTAATNGERTGNRPPDPSII